MKEKRNHIVYGYREYGREFKYIGQRNGSLAKRAGNDGAKYKGQSVYDEWISKVGWNNIEKIILQDNLTLDEANQWETYYIKRYNTIYPYGYNKNYGGYNNSCTSTEKCVIQCLDNKIVNIFINMTQAAMSFDMSQTTIHKYCDDGDLHGGYLFKIVNVDKIIFDTLQENNNPKFYDVKEKVKIQDLNNWTQYQINYLKKNYSIKTCKEISDEINRSERSVQAKAKELDLVTIKNWSVDEENRLKELWKQKDDIDIYTHFPNRSERAIDSKAFKLGLTISRKWTTEMDEIIFEWYPIEGSEVYKRIPGKSRNACYERANHLGIRRNDWNDKKIDLLIGLAKTESNYKVIAKKLHTDYKEIKMKLSELGIDKQGTSSKYKYVSYDKSRNKYMVRIKYHGNNFTCRCANEFDAMNQARLKCQEFGIEYPDYN